MASVNSCLNCLLALLMEIKRKTMSTEALALIILDKGGQKNTCVLAELLSWVVKRLSDREAFYRQKNTDAHRGEQMLALNVLAVAHLTLSAP